MPSSAPLQSGIELIDDAAKALNIFAKPPQAVLLLLATGNSQIKFLEALIALGG